MRNGRVDWRLGLDQAIKGQLETSENARNLPLLQIGPSCHRQRLDMVLPEMPLLVVEIK